MTNNTKPYIKELVRIAVFVAVICILAQISIPISLIPITFQVFAVSLCGYTLGKKKSVVAVLVYLILGAAGAPVFAGFTGGFHMLISYTGGFLWGFIPLALFCSLARSKKIGILFGIIGVILCHIIGVVQYSIIAKIGIWQSFIVASLPFVLKDIILVIISYFIAKRINKILKGML